MKTRKVFPGEVHHVCQQTIDGVVVFYTVSDYLVYFTLFCTVAKRYGIKVLALCPMVDHTHNTVVVQSRLQLSRFVQQYTHLFAKEWNISRRRKGPLFRARFKSAAKLGNKAVKTTINYNNNNPVERKMVTRAELYRWNFLRYARESYPFSVPIVLSNKSWRFRGILKELETTYKGGGYLRYAQLQRWMKRLDANEMQQIADYAIVRWNVIDYAEVISYYGDYDTLLRSLHDNTGSEYDIKEDRDNYSDEVYQDCSRILLKEGIVKSLLEIPLLPLSMKKEAARLLRQRTTARPRQIKKYLHLKDDF